MVKISIREFVDSIINDLPKDALYPDWDKLLSEAGFHYVDLDFPISITWSAVHDWCRMNVGSGHYVWTGSRFWFENKESSILFAIRWL